MLTVNITNIPEYLRTGELFQSFDIEGNDKLTVPSDYFRPDAIITNDEELEHLLKTLRFWNVLQVPWELVDYTAFDKSTTWDVCRRYEHDLPFLTSVQCILTAKNRLNAAATLGSVEWLRYVHDKLQQPMTREALEFAADLGYLSCLVYGCACSTAPEDLSTWNASGTFSAVEISA